MAGSHAVHRRWPFRYVWRPPGARGASATSLHAALTMQEELNRYSDGLRAQGRKPVQARVGVNTGEVVVRSLVTDAAHAEYTPIGHSIGLAARMQALAPLGS